MTFNITKENAKAMVAKRWENTLKIKSFTIQKKNGEVYLVSFEVGGKMYVEKSLGLAFIAIETLLTPTKTLK